VWFISKKQHGDLFGQRKHGFDKLTWLFSILGIELMTPIVFFAEMRLITLCWYVYFYMVVEYTVISLYFFRLEGFPLKLEFKDDLNMNDNDVVNFSEDYELNRHLELVGKSKSIDNREYLRENTGPRAKKELGKRVLTHAEFKPYVKEDKPSLADPA